MIAEIVKESIWNALIKSLAMAFEAMVPFLVECVVEIVFLSVIAKLVYKICMFIGVSKKKSRKIAEGVEVIANLKDIYGNVKKS